MPTIENLRFEWDKPIPTSSLDILCYVYSNKVNLIESQFGDLVREEAFDEPTFSFWGHISRIYDQKVQQSGSVSNDQMIEVIARTDDVYNPTYEIQLDDIITLDVKTNTKYSIFAIMREEYKYGTIIRASKLGK